MTRLIRNHSIKRLLLTAIFSTLIICSHKPPLEPVASVAKPINNTHATIAPAPADLTTFNLANPATWPTCANDEWHWADDGQCHKRPITMPAATIIANTASNDRTCEKWRPLIAQYDWNVNVAVNVCTAESGGDPNTANWTDGHPDIGCTGSFGLFELHCGHGQIYDPAQNIAIAYSMYQASGWKPWGATTCQVKVACY